MLYIRFLQYKDTGNSRIKPEFIKALVVIIAVVVTSSVVQAQQDRLLVDIAPCVVLESAIQRYVCYEDQAKAALGGADDAVASPASSARPEGVERPRNTVTGHGVESGSPSAPVAGSGRARTEEDFGFPENEEELQKEIEVLTSVISSLQETLPSQYMITLENGQVWRQVRPEPRYRLQPGHHVNIYPTRWGADYRMGIEEFRGGFIQVQRIR